MEEKSCLHVIIEGRVQGVGFRYFVLQKANEIGVNGWVRNRYQGDVEVLAEGDPSKLNRLLAFLRSGPPSSNVDTVKHDWKEASEQYSRFSVSRTV